MNSLRGRSLVPLLGHPDDDWPLTVGRVVQTKRSKKTGTRFLAEPLGLRLGGKAASRCVAATILPRQSSEGALAFRLPTAPVLLEVSTAFAVSLATPGLVMESKEGSGNCT